MAEEQPSSSGVAQAPIVTAGPFWQLTHAASSFSYRLPEAMIFVGREACDVTVQARSVDKRHAVIMYDYCDKRFKVKDLNSANGTFVNEVRIPVQTYIQLDSMDLLRFGFDSAAYQVVRVPGSEEAPADQTMQLKISTSEPEQQPGGGSRPHSPQESSKLPAGRESRAASEEPEPRTAVTRNLSAPLPLGEATSNSSLHSAFSEDSLLGDSTAKPTMHPEAPTLVSPVLEVVPEPPLSPVSSPPTPSVVEKPHCVPPLPSPLQPCTSSPSETSTSSGTGNTPSSSSSPSSGSAPLPQPAEPEPQPALHPMAFTVDFADDSGSKKFGIGDSISKFVPRHRRNLSLTRQEEAKQQRLERVQEADQQAKVVSPPGNVPHSPPAVSTASVSASAPAPAVLVQLRRAGYHSEGYFSSDQEEDLSTKSELSVRKAKAIEKAGMKATNLAQEKKTKIECVPRGPVEKLKLVPQRVTPETKRAVSLEESASEHFSRILAEQQSSRVPRQASCGPPPRQEIKQQEEEDTDNVSEAGTYTIDKDSPSPEETRARSEIDVVFGVADDIPTSPCNTRTFTRPKIAPSPAPDIQHTNGHDDPPKSASYRGGPNWIKEWAASVTELQNLNHPGEVILPPISRGKGRVPSPSRGGAGLGGWPPSNETTHINSASRGRHKLPSLHTAASPVLTSSDHSDPAESPVRRRPPDRAVMLHQIPPERVPDTETESYLRATESVVTAMQARMSGGVAQEEEEDSDEGQSSAAARELSAQLRAKLRVLEQKASSPKPSAAPRRPQNSGTTRVQQREEGGRQSDSSSEAGDMHKSRPRADSASSATAPHTSLRRARLEAEEAEKSRVKSSPAPVTSRVTAPRASANNARPRKLEPSRPSHNSSAAKPPVPTNSSGNFSRADGGRFSLRAGKVANQTQPPAAIPKSKPANASRKEPAKKSSGGRSNSSLNSKEVEFQNWKRRKSYDPMKAAAEGKKKAEAARKAVNTNVNALQNNIMTQSAIVMTSNASPNSSPLNSILRSASFHGTGGMARTGSFHGSAATSEDEATLSAEEDLIVMQSPSPVSPRHPRARPSPLPTPLRAVSQPPDHNTNSHSRKSSVDETMDGASSRGFIRNTTPTSSVRSRGKLEALDNLVIAAIHGFSNKIKGSSHNVLSKLRVLFQEDPEKASMLEDTLAMLEEGEPQTSSPSKSPSKELSGTLRNLKKLEHVFTVLDEVLFGEEEDIEDEEDEELELSDLEADQLVN